ncbi:aminotransferase class I/II-fold pyridoxal phosphate-dependent enzyme [bacterium]|nr:aminotransferase class I/II-fold pyridoxal phosphate-dependent enzyme [bacterium]MBU1884055.1 aminotransferase class I/II-fold pyridoxal phosphate-dependent enzyme [bacterium]
MNYYVNELKALKKSNRYRTREIVDYSLKDFASNDYLGLASNKELHILTCKELSLNPVHSPKASLLVSGYHQIHKDFEATLCEVNGFEDAVVLGSGFNANIALIESLVRKGDTLFMDEKFHASGVLASNLNELHVEFFKHNDSDELKRLLQASDAKRKIVAVEGIYSMDGDLMDEKIFAICDEEDAILIVDEAHSSGVVGENLMGVYDLFDIKIKPNYIKMGTLGKAYGSFGAYILASSHIVEYLTNRAKPIIYATSLSLYDTLLAHNSLKYILQNKREFKEKIIARQRIVKEILHVDTPSLVVPIIIGDNKKVIDIRDELRNEGYIIGAIRQPTVESAILRIIARIDDDISVFQELCERVKRLLDESI